MKTKPLSASQQALASLNIPKSDTATIPMPQLSKCHKISVSLFDADLEALDRLIDRLWQECGVRAGRSDAAKLAVRFAADQMDTPSLISGYRGIKSEDRRR